MNDTEKNALERRIDELCAEVERLHAEQVYWELGNCPNCPNIVSLQEALEQITKLRELVRDLWLCGALCDVIPDMRLQVKGGDWRTMQERVDEALGIEVPE